MTIFTHEIKVQVEEMLNKADYREEQVAALQVLAICELIDVVKDLRQHLAHVVYFNSISRRLHSCTTRLVSPPCVTRSAQITSPSLNDSIEFCPFSAVSIQAQGLKNTTTLSGCACNGDVSPFLSVTLRTLTRPLSSTDSYICGATRTGSRAGDCAETVASPSTTGSPIMAPIRYFLFKTRILVRSNESTCPAGGDHPGLHHRYRTAGNR